MAASSRGAMQRLKMYVNRRLSAGMMEQAVDVMMTSEVVDDQTGYGGARQCSRQNAMTATLKSPRCGRRS